MSDCLSSDCLSYGSWTSRAEVVRLPKFGSGVAAVEWLGSAVMAGRAAAQLFARAH